MNVKWPERMPERHQPPLNNGAANNVRVVVRLLTVLSLLIPACFSVPAVASDAAVVPKRIELAAGESHTLNYTPWYIHTFEIEDSRGSRIRGGGGNTWPMSEDQTPGEGGGVCCTTYPVEWQPDLKITVRWIADKKQDGKTLGYWYKSEDVRIEQYAAHQTAGVWAIFLPDDRIKVVVGNPDAHDLAPNAGPPARTDPYVAKGSLDDEWNRLYRDGGNS